MKVCLTGGIACGKSLLSHFLNAFGISTIDADDIVHELIPAEERARLAKKVFADPAARRELEARIHPLVRARIDRALNESDGRTIAVIPLLFETHWDAEYDIIACVKSEPETQIRRMMTTRGYTREEAEARLAAQMPIAEKAARSDYVIANDGTPEELKSEARRFADWLRSKYH